MADDAPDMDRLTALITPHADALGLAVVRVTMLGGTSDPTLQVMAERPDTRQLTLEDCAALSRSLSETLDALEVKGQDPIPFAYRLEISSPGIDRPLTRRQDYNDWAGHDARIRMAEPLDGRKQFDGVLAGLAGDAVLLTVPKSKLAADAGPLHIPLNQIRSAKLMLTDRLIAATAPLNADGADKLQLQKS